METEIKSKQVGIIGYGRFGRFWASLLRSHHTVWFTDTQVIDDPAYLSLKDLCEKAEVIFLCVPIGKLETVLNEMAGFVKRGSVVFDTCSVKTLPATLMQNSLGQIPDITLIAAHPMFGPDSARNGVQELPFVNWQLTGSRSIFENWSDFFKSLGMKVVEVSPEMHDQLAAYSQGVTHYIGRVLEQLDLKATPIDTQGFSILLSLIEQTCNDSWELFHDLQIQNPYTQEMRLKLEKALDEVYAALLPARVSQDAILVGVQGGEGSFSEEASRTFVHRQDEADDKFQVRHLFTTENVLQALHKGEIDFGVFAIQNAAGGVVMESIQAMSQTNCDIIEIFDLVINHSIMHHPDVDFGQVDTVISHPQALAQCAQNLKARYPHLKAVSGEGNMIDQALCAKELAHGRLPKTTAVLASKVCAHKYGLTLHDNSLQDLGEDNLTTFVWATRKARG